MNINSPLLDARGLQCFVVGATAYKTFQAGHYRVALDWIEDEPALVIWTTTAHGAFAICLSSAAKYAEPDGRPSREGVRELLLALPVLGRSRTEPELHQLLDVVLRYMPDLLHMPPAPREVRLEAAGAPLIDITEKSGDGRILREVSM